MPRRSRRGPGAKVIVLVHGGPGLSLTYLKIFNRPASPAEQIGLFCMPQLADAECPKADQIGSARDYLLGFAWSGATVMVQPASGPSVCLFIGALRGELPHLPPRVPTAGRRPRARRGEVPPLTLMARYRLFSWYGRARS